MKNTPIKIGGEIKKNKFLNCSILLANSKS